MITIKLMTIIVLTRRRHMTFAGTPLVPTPFVSLRAVPGSGNCPGGLSWCPGGPLVPTPFVSLVGFSQASACCLSIYKLNNNNTH